MKKLTKKIFKPVAKFFKIFFRILYRIIDLLIITPLSKVVYNIGDMLSNRNSSFDKILKGIKLMQESGASPEIQVTTCVNKKNIGELEEIYQLMREIGITNWRIITVDPIGRAKDNDELLLSADEFKKVFHFMFEKRIENPDMKIMYGCGHFFGAGAYYERRRPHQGPSGAPVRRQGPQGDRVHPVRGQPLR